MSDVDGLTRWAYGLASEVALESGLHGPRHWRDVARIAAALAQRTPKANAVVATLFALLHDTQRLDDDADPAHGPRAAEVIRRHVEELRRYVPDLSDEDIGTLLRACEQHTHSGPVDAASDPTVAVCFDADRLTLWRVGVRPDEDYLSTEAGRRGATRMWAWALINDDDVDWEDIFAALAVGEPLDSPPELPRTAEPRTRPTEAPTDSVARRDSQPTEALHPALAPYVEHSDALPMLRHPLVVVAFYSPTMNATINEQYAAKLAALDHALAQRNYHSYIYLHERPFRAQALHDIMDDLSRDAMGPLVASVWKDTENAWQNAEVWTEIFADVRLAGASLMNSDDHAAYDELPDVFTVHRGFSGAGTERGLSWSLSHDTAVWFARRLRGADPMVATATVKKADVLALLQSGGESEVLIEPDNLPMLRLTPA